MEAHEAATNDNVIFQGLTSADTVRFDMNGGMVNLSDIQELGAQSVIIDGSSRATSENPTGITINVPVVAPGFVATVLTDPADDPELQVGGGQVSLHGSIPADLINVSDNVSSESDDDFNVNDDSALEGTLVLAGNQSQSGLVNDNFTVINTATANLVTELMGGTGTNVFDIIHGGVNQNIAITGGAGGNTLILDRIASSAAEPDCVTMIAVSTPSGPGVSVTGIMTSVVATGVTNITVNINGTTLDMGDLAAVGATSITVNAYNSPASDFNHMIIEPPLLDAPDNLTVSPADAGVSVQDVATDASYQINSGYDLQVMPWTDGSNWPTLGQNRAIVGLDSAGLLHVRYFDSSGVRTDTYETMEDGELHLVTADASGNILSDSPESSLSSDEYVTIYQFKTMYSTLGPVNIPGSGESNLVYGSALQIASQPLAVFQQDDVRIKINGGGSETVIDPSGGPDPLPHYPIIFDGQVRGNPQNPAGNTLNVTVPPLYYVPATGPQSPAGLSMSMITDASGDPELTFGSGGGIVVVHGPIPADKINLNIAEERGDWGGGFASPPSATNQVSVDASQLQGTLNINIVPDDAQASGPWFFTNSFVNISNVNPLASIVVNGINHDDFPYPDASDVANSGYATVTVGDGLLSQIEGDVTVNYADLTVDNSLSTDTDILTMTETSLAGWIVPEGVSPPTLSFTPVLYNNMVVQAGNDENISVEAMPKIELLTFQGGQADIYSTFEGNYAVTIENTATSAAPDSVYVMSTNPSDNLSIAGDYSLYVGQRLNPDGTVTDVGDVDGIKGAIILDYTGTGGNANLVFDAAIDNYRVYGSLIYNYFPYLVTPAGDTVLTGVFATTVYGGIAFNSSNINFTFDSDVCPGSINNGGDTLYLDNPGTDTVTYNATPVSGSTQIANHVVLYNSGVPITINGNGNTEVDFSQDESNDFNLYSGIQANVFVNDASIDVAENSETLPDVVLTGDSLTGATTGTIDFTNSTGFTFQTNPATLMTMTVVNTPANITTDIDITNTNLTILATTGPLNVTGSEGEYPDSNVTIGDGTLAGIDGNIVVTGFGSAANTGIIMTILDQNASPASNVVITSSSVGAETITGLIPATIAFNGQSALNLYTPAYSTDTVYQSVDTFNLYAGAGSTVNLDHSAYDINDLTVLGAAQVNVAQGDPTFIDYGAGAAGSLNIEADPARPTAVTDVTINATSIGGYQLTLGDGLEGFDSFQFGLSGGTPGTINLQASTVALTLELPTSVVNHLSLTVNDTGALLTTIDEGAVPTTVAGTTGPLTLLSSYPGTITLGSAGSVQGLNGAVDVETPSLPSTAGMLVVADSADTTARSATIMPATGGLYSITGLAPAPIEYTAAGYTLAFERWHRQ